MSETKIKIRIKPQQKDIEKEKLFVTEESKAKPDTVALKTSEIKEIGLPDFSKIKSKFAGLRPSKLSFPFKSFASGIASSSLFSRTISPGKKTKESETKKFLKKKKSPRRPIFGSYSTKDLVHFSKRLAFLIRSGVPLMESLHLLQKQTKAKSKKKILEVIIDDVANGRLLSAGLARFRESFGDFAINVIRVGEMSGGLSNNLVYLSEELQKRYALRRKIIGALVYPAFITVATIGVSTLLTVYIFPKVMPIFTSLNVTLPFTTKALLFISNYLRHWGILTLFGLIGIVIAVFFAIRLSKKFHFFIARNILRLPLIGNLVLNYNMANFCRTMGLLLRSGFNVVEAATVTSDSTPNPVYKIESVELRERIIRGERISSYLEERPKLFPDIVAHMIAIGETSGTLSDSLMYLSEHYEAEVDDAVKNLSSSIEPVLMVFMGVIVGFVAVSVITPIYEVTQHLQR